MSVQENYSHVVCRDRGVEEHCGCKITLQDIDKIINLCEVVQTGMCKIIRKLNSM